VIKTPIQDLKESSIEETDSEEEQEIKIDMLELPVHVVELPVQTPVKMCTPILEMMNEQTP
jgi:hypothetical protein